MGKSRRRATASQSRLAKAALDRAAAIDLPIPLVIFERGLTIRWISRTAIEEFRLNPTQVIGRTWYELFPEAKSRSELHEELFSGERTHLDLFNITLPSAPTRHFSFRLRPKRLADGVVEYVIGVAEDITAHVQAQQALRESEERFRSAFEYAAIGKALVSPDGRWLRVNQALCRIVGYSQEELLEIDFQTITHPDDLTTDLEFVREMLAGTRTYYEMEKRYLHKAGHSIWILLSVSMVRDDVGRPLYFISQIQDISERRRLEEALLKHTSSEQKQWGQELHDGLGQELAGLSLLAAAFATKAERLASPLAADALELSKIARHAVATCRDIARGVSPLTDTRGGLVSGLRQLTDRLAAIGGPNIRFKATEKAPMNLTWETRNQLFRIAQDALDNALVHSGAENIKITIRIDSHLVRLTVTDNGRGPSAASTAHSSLGVETMRYRAATIRARLRIRTLPSGGTTVICECPQPSSAFSSESVP
jgi:two-component system sensor histidine kinase UhpB